MPILPILLAAAAVPSAAPLWELVPPVEPCTLPASSWTPKTSTSGWGYGIEYDAGRLSWNGVPVNEYELLNYSRAAATFEPPVDVTLYAPGGDCAELRRIAALVAKEAHCQPEHCFIIYASRASSLPQAPVPPAPPGPSASTIVKPPSPRASPQRWVINDDYPLEAVRGHMDGTTGFTLVIDAQGRVKDCIVRGSSGFALLDETTCRLLTRRARFTPAETRDGTPVPSRWSSRFRWELPDVSTGLASWARLTRYEVDASGAVVNCATRDYGPAPLWGDECRHPRWATDEPPQWKGAPMWVEVRETHQIGGPPKGLPRASGQPLFRRDVRYSVDGLGRVAECRMMRTSGTSPFEFSYTCHSGLKYDPAEARDSTRNPRRGIDYSITITTGPLKPKR